MKIKPSITVNKLAEFIIANPARQRNILYMLKYPDKSKFASTTYGTSRDALKDFFTSGFNFDFIHDAISYIEASKPSSDHAKKMANAEIEALNNVAGMLLIEDEFPDYEFHLYDGDNEKFIIENVEVSVYPDLIVTSQSKRKKSYGLLKLHFSKNNALNLDAGESVANVLYHYAEAGYIDLPGGYKLENTHCASFDVFTGNIITCPKGVKRKFGEIKAACQNIADIWPSI